MNCENTEQLKKFGIVRDDIIHKILEEEKMEFLVEIITEKGSYIYTNNYSKQIIRGGNVISVAAEELRLGDFVNNLKIKKISFLEK